MKEQIILQKKKRKLYRKKLEKKQKLLLNQLPIPPKRMLPEMITVGKMNEIIKTKMIKRINVVEITTKTNKIKTEITTTKRKTETVIIVTVIKNLILSLMLLLKVKAFLT